MKTIVCLPTFNEIKSVEVMIDRVKKAGLDVMLCDQGSTDGTIEKALSKNVPVYQRDGFGKGWGIRKALDVTVDKGYDILVMIDCDCTYYPEDIPLLLKDADTYDMIVGIRNMKDIQFSHRLVNMLHTFLINLFFVARLKDINSGLRAMRAEKFAGILDAEGFDIEAQISAKAARRRFKIAEVPIRYTKRVGKSKIRAGDTFRIINRILLERFRDGE